MTHTLPIILLIIAKSFILVVFNQCCRINKGEWSIVTYVLLLPKGKIKLGARISTVKFTKSFTNNCTTMRCTAVYRVISYANEDEIHFCWGLFTWEWKEVDNEDRRELLNGSTGCLYCVCYFIGLCLLLNLCTEY